MMRIINIYDRRDVRTGERPASKINWSRIIQQREGTILAGDFNAHSRRWNPRSKEQWDATFWEDIIDKY